MDYKGFKYITVKEVSEFERLSEIPTQQAIFVYFAFDISVIKTILQYYFLL